MPKRLTYQEEDCKVDGKLTVRVGFTCELLKVVHSFIAFRNGDFFDIISTPTGLNIHPVSVDLWSKAAVQPLTDASPKCSG